MLDVQIDEAIGVAVLKKLGAIEAALGYLLSKLLHA